jgi:hypothetical protein
MSTDETITVIIVAAEIVGYYYLLIGDVQIMLSKANILKVKAVLAGVT